jgi:UDP-N-acetylmuramyl pentapeptide phosphotransferase/UDP-N-acetylglucosamine-1-phosphate transferase
MAASDFFGKRGSPLTEHLRPADRLWLTGALVLALGGLAGFILIFVRHMDVYWFILSPMILAVYEIPAVVVYGTWKKRRRKTGPAPLETALEEQIPHPPFDDVQP